MAQTQARPHRKISLLVALALVGTAACNGESTPDVTAPLPGTRPPGTATTVDATTTSATPTIAATTPAATTIPGATSEPAGSTTVAPTTPPTPPTATAQPVATLIPQVRAPLDPNDPNNQRPVPSPEEQAIINAYIIGSDATQSYLAAFPRSADAPSIVDGPFTDSYLADIRVFDTEMADSRVVLDVQGGLTYRPYVVGFEPNITEVLIADCQLDATVWRDVDTGSVVDPPLDGYPNTGPAEATPVGFGAVMVLQDGLWLVDSVYTDGQACIDL